MKRGYLTLLMLLLGGVLMAQTTTTITDNKKEVKQNNATVSSAANSNSSNQTIGTSEVKTKPEVIQNGAITSKTKSNATSTPEVDLPGFPVYVSTGDDKQDKINYFAAKDKWISENQDLYNNYLNSKNNNNEPK